MAGDFVPNRPDEPEQEIAQLGLEGAASFAIWAKLLPRTTAKRLSTTSACFAY
jgi:hypothetical protein